MSKHKKICKKCGKCKKCGETLKQNSPIKCFQDCVENNQRVSWCGSSCQEKCARNCNLINCSQCSSADITCLNNCYSNNFP